MFLFALAQAAVAAAPAAVTTPLAAPAAAQEGVTTYGPDFFAAMRPANALEMVQRLPGFSLDVGDSVRGYEGAAGNVLVDGQRPTSKTDSLDEYLRRIPAAAVARIDVIRGGAPGIDMHGKTMIANVIRKTGDGLRLVAVGVYVPSFNGKTDWGMRLEGSKRAGETSYEGSLLLVNSPDDGTGDGPHTVTNAAGEVIEHDLEHAFGDAGLHKLTGAVETPLAGGRIRVEGSFLNNGYILNVNDLSPDPASRQFELYKSDADTGEMGLRYTRKLGARTDLELYALQQLGTYASDDNLVSPGDIFTFQVGKRTGESILRATATYAAGRTLSVESGVEGDFNWLTSRTRETDGGVSLPVPAANVHVTEWRG